MNKYIVEDGITDSVPNCETVEGLTRYLDQDPHPSYHLVSVVRTSGNWVIVWELGKNVEWFGPR